MLTVVVESGPFEDQTIASLKQQHPGARLRQWIVSHADTP